jgi:tricorn protease interacting factor F2/3
LRKFSYSNATGEDFWKSVQKASGQPVSRIMGRWIRTPGFPLVKVEYSNGKLAFTQERFQLGGETDKAVWPIPLTFATNGKRRKVLLEKHAMTVDAPDLASLCVNLEHAGFYSVLYSSELQETVAGSFNRFSPFEKAGFMNDMYLFLLAGKVEPETYRRFASLCSHQEHPVVVETVAGHLSLLYTIANEAEPIRKCVTEFALAQAERLGFSPRKGEAPHDAVAREVVMSLLARLDTKYTKRLAGMFPDYEEVDPSLKEAVAVAYARVHGKEVFEQLTELVKSTKSEVDRSRIYSALTSFDDPKLVEKALELGISGEVSRSDSAYTLTRAAANPLARDVLWEWLKKRFEKLWTMYAGSQQVLLYYEAVVPRCAVGKPGEVGEFFSGEKMKRGGMAFRRAIESVEIRTKLRERLLADA